MGATSSELARGLPTGNEMGLGAVAAITGTIGGGCSATLIADRVLLSAAHCLMPHGAGCFAPPGTAASPDEWFAVFGDPTNGNPEGAGAQRIRILGASAHPDAWGGRPLACDAQNPALVACPGTLDQQPPSCELVRMCPEHTLAGSRIGFHHEHDIALLYLESTPVGIQPLPVIVDPGAGAAHSNLFEYPGGLANWYDKLGFLGMVPIVTLVGYGGGSTNWCEPDGWCGGRDYGTAPLVTHSSNENRSDRCDGVRGPIETVESPRVSATSTVHAFARGGDSGGPMLAGHGPVATGLDEPTPLAAPGLPEGRYVIGVASTGGDVPTGPACGSDQDCSPNQVCHGERCADICEATHSCTDGTHCEPDQAGGPGRCLRPGATYASTYANGNGTWIRYHLDDFDGDGVPNYRDNCVGVANSDQANCNLDAERDRQAEELGDACDPVPCPEPRALLVEEVAVTPNVGVSDCARHQTVRAVARDIGLMPIASHNRFNGAEREQLQVRTDYRFCQEDLKNNVFCDLANKQRRDDQFDQTDASGIWRRMTLPALGARGAPSFVDYPSTPDALAWDYWADRAHWLANSLIADPGTPAKPSKTPDSDWTTSSGLQGALGVRAGGPRSAMLLGTHNWDGNGQHWSPDLGDGYRMGQGLGRGYIDKFAPDGIITHSYNHCYWEAGCNGAGCPNGILQRLRWCAQCESPLGLWDAGRPADILIARTAAGEWGPVDRAGRIITNPAVLEPELQSKLSDSSLVFVAAAEPFSEMGDGFGAAQGALLRADATAIDSFVVAKESGFGLASQIGPHVVRSTQTISGRRDFVPVLSRLRDELIIVGGTELATGKQAEDILSFPAWGPPRRLAVQGYSPAKVLAATVSSADLALWVLDELPGRGLKQVRLVRIDLEVGEVETVWQGRRPGLFDRHWLSVDRDGQVLLFASSQRIRKHATIRFEAERFAMGTARPVVLRFGMGDLYGEPLVDRGGYRYVVRGKKDRLTTIHVEDLLSPAPGPGPFDLSESF